jgi:hypothetical protein
MSVRSGENKIVWNLVWIRGCKCENYLFLRSFLSRMNLKSFKLILEALKLYFIILVILLSGNNIFNLFITFSQLFIILNTSNDFSTLVNFSKITVQKMKDFHVLKYDYFHAYKIRLSVSLFSFTRDKCFFLRTKSI